MNLRPLYSALALACCSALPLAAQNAAPAIKHQHFLPAATKAPGAAPDKVWLNAPTRIYHCPTDRYYGRTKDGQYMTEPEARATGARGARGATCFK